MLSLSFLESMGSIYPRRVSQSGVGLEFFETNESEILIDALVIVRGRMGRGSLRGVRDPKQNTDGSDQGG